MISRTRVVRWLRVLLPLIALAILSTMFLFSREPTGEPQIPYADVDAEDMARDPRMVAPEYAGVTKDGAQLTLVAKEARPGEDEGDVALRTFRLDWRATDGQSAEITAPEGSVADGRIQLSGGVLMTTSAGWTITAPQIDASIDRSDMMAEEGILAHAPFGDLTAGVAQLHLPDDVQGADGNGSAKLDFSGGVRLIYQP